MTNEQAKKTRLLRLLSARIDVSIGTVWRVRESFWIDSFRSVKQPYDVDSERDWHPGVSLRVAPLTCVHEFIPMLHGSSGDHGPVVARGLSKEKGPEHPTSFGKILRPARVSFNEINAKKAAPKAVDLEGRFIDRSPVSANLDKPRLSETELADLRRWAGTQNLI